MTVYSLGSMADGEDNTVFADDCIGIELWFKHLEDLGALCAAEPIASVMIEEHEFAAPVIVNFSAIGQ
jgi:hypothetical protein